MKKNRDSTPIKKIRENISPIPLSNFNDIKASIIQHAKGNAKYRLKDSKMPYGKWKDSITNPENYKGWNDTKRGSAILAQRVMIDDEPNYLAIIDLDNKPNQSVPIEALKETFQDIIDNTYTVETPSGGYHIYLLSKKETAREQPPKDSGIDYQITNYQKKSSAGKYVVHNSRIELVFKGKIITPQKALSEFKKDFDIGEKSYNKVSKLFNDKFTPVKKEYKMLNNQDVLIVDDTDTLLDEKLMEIQEKGYLVEKDLELGTVMNIVSLLKSYTVEGQRNDLALGLSGFLRKNDFNINEVKYIFKKIFAEDEEICKRIETVENSFEKSIEEIGGYEILSNLLVDADFSSLLEIINPFDEIDSLLQHHFNRGPGKMGSNSAIAKDRLAILMMQSLNKDGYILVKDKHTKNAFIHHDNTGFISVDGVWITEHFNKKFRGNVAYEDCTKVIKQINKFKEIDYNLLEFTNGVLNTKTMEFKENVKCKDSLPKMKLPYKWNKHAKGDRLEQMMLNITSTDKPGFERNYETLILAVGNSFMKLNKEALLIALVGRPGTGKTVFIDNIIKRMFEYSEVSLKSIAERNRFAYYPLFYSEVNINNDVSSVPIKHIGNLNSVIEGNVPKSEVKNSNDRLSMPSGVGPKFWITGNELPSVFGAGFERRLCLIWVDNPFDKSFFKKKITGEEIEWLIYTSITKVAELYNKGQTIVTDELSKDMNAVWQNNSDPYTKAIDHIFEFDSGSSIRTKDAMGEIKKFLNLAHKKGRIFKSLKKPNFGNIKQGMSNAGYGYVNKCGRAYYECCSIRDGWEWEVDKVL